MRREGEFWTIVFSGETCRLRHTVGLLYLAYLLARPHVAVPALEVRAAAVPGAAPAGVADRRATERARVNVTRALKGVLGRLRKHHPPLFEHLQATLRTGAHCTYRPDPRVELGWDLECN